MQGLKQGSDVLPRRMRDHCWTTGGQLRFYCGAPLIAANNHRIGTLCARAHFPGLRTNSFVAACIRYPVMMHGQDAGGAWRRAHMFHMDLPSAPATVETEAVGMTIPMAQQVHSRQPAPEL